MCTVSYLPTGKNSFILSSNRDEAPSRNALKLTRQELSSPIKDMLLYPKEPTAGGTWLCAASSDRLVCLLNGAFASKFEMRAYRRSRGLVVLDYFTYADTQQFLEQYNFDQIAPFTMVIYDKGNLTEFRWHKQKHIKQLDPQKPYIWSSATLYPLEMREKRQEWFAEWLAQHPVFTPDNIFEFHCTGGEGDSMNDLVMNRGNIVRTVSISTVIKQADSIALTYRDLLANNITKDSIAVQKAPENNAPTLNRFVETA